MIGPDVRTPGGNPASAETTTADAASVADAKRKEQARLTVYAARRGYVVHALGTGSFLLGRWGHCKELADLPALAAALRQMGVQP